MFSRENLQNSEPQNGPRSGLDYIALELFDSVYNLDDVSCITILNKNFAVKTIG